MTYPIKNPITWPTFSKREYIDIPVYSGKSNIYILGVRQYADIYGDTYYLLTYAINAEIQQASFQDEPSCNKYMDYLKIVGKLINNE